MATAQHTNERNAQIVVSLLKQHGIRKVIVSPGTTNQAIAVTVQNDNFFQVYSCVDERSAAYMACGMCATSGEPVAISCTGATASRNYLPGLTEAFYRKLPVIAITSFNGNQNVGQLVPQALDRTHIQHDVALKSVDVPIIKDDEDALYCNRIINDALLESTHHGGGPVHINLTTSYDNTFIKGLVPQSRCIRRYTHNDTFPDLDQFKKIIITIGSHRPFSEDEEKAIAGFVQSHQAVVFCDHTSNYQGFGRLLSTFATDNLRKRSQMWDALRPNLIISIGDISGDYPSNEYLKATHAESWRVALDGAVRDRFGTLSTVFECSELDFFEQYKKNDLQEKSYLKAWQTFDCTIREQTPVLPYSYRWIAQQSAPAVPENSIVHFAILNSLRSFNYFDLSRVRGFSNTGGFGIDGALSTVLGSALAEPNTLHFIFVGDLAFFYDMNALGNRDFPTNIRILLVNNKVGCEMHMKYSICGKLGDEGLPYVCAADHFQSHADVSAAQSWSEVMGLDYLSASDKQTFQNVLPMFFDAGHRSNSLVLECFTDPEKDVLAGDLLQHVDMDLARKEKLIQSVKGLMPQSAIQILKKVIH